jgi:hypothetical protein
MPRPAAAASPARSRRTGRRSSLGPQRRLNRAGRSQRSAIRIAPIHSRNRRRSGTGHGHREQRSRGTRGRDSGAQPPRGIPRSREMPRRYRRQSVRFRPENPGTPVGDYTSERQSHIP